MTLLQAITAAKICKLITGPIYVTITKKEARHLTTQIDFVHSSVWDGDDVASWELDGQDRLQLYVPQ